MYNSELDRLVAETKGFDEKYRKRLLICHIIMAILAIIIIPIFVYYALYCTRYDIGKYGEHIIRPTLSTTIFMIVPDEYEGIEMDSTDLSALYVQGLREQFPNTQFAYLSPEDGLFVRNQYYLGIPYSYIVYKDSVTLDKYHGNDDEIVVPDSIWGKPVTKISSDCFNNVSESLKSIVLPDSVESIESETFREYINLERVVGNNIKEIGNIAFADCVKLSQVEVGNQLQIIGNQAFSHCYQLKYLKPQKQLELVEWYAFRESGITEFEFNEDADVISTAFDETPWLENWPDDFVIIGDKLVTYEGNGGNGYIVIPDGVRIITEYSMFGLPNNTSITKVWVPDSVTKIEEDAFLYDCDMMIYLPASVIDFGGWDNISLSGDVKPVKNTIVTTEKSCAHKYALEHDVPFVIVKNLETAWAADNAQ